MYYKPYESYKSYESYKLINPHEVGGSLGRALGLWGKHMMSKTCFSDFDQSESGRPDGLVAFWVSPEVDFDLVRCFSVLRASLDARNDNL